MILCIHRDKFLCDKVVNFLNYLHNLTGLLYIVSYFSCDKVVGCDNFLFTEIMIMFTKFCN